jgi:hypothetical protein
VAGVISTTTQGRETAKKRRPKKQQRERASNRLEMFLVSICVWLNTAACKRLYETGGITNEGGEKTILQSNNMVALRVIYFHLDASQVWYGRTIMKTTSETTFIKDRCTYTYKDIINLMLGFGTCTVYT